MRIDVLGVGFDNLTMARGRGARRWSLLAQCRAPTMW